VITVNALPLPVFFPPHAKFLPRFLNRFFPLFKFLSSSPPSRNPSSGDFKNGIYRESLPGNSYFVQDSLHYFIRVRALPFFFTLFNPRSPICPKDIRFRPYTTTLPAVYEGPPQVILIDNWRGFTLILPLTTAKDPI